MVWGPPCGVPTQRQGRQVTSSGTMLVIADRTADPAPGADGLGQVGDQTGGLGDDCFEWGRIPTSSL